MFQTEQERIAWTKTAPAILERIQVPLFPDKSILIGPSDNFRLSVQTAIDTLHEEGGGRIVVAAGTYFCNGPLHLRSNIHLHFQKGAVVKFSANPVNYAPLVKVRWEGTVCYNYSPLFYSYQQKNMAITGSCILDGQADQFWHQWKKQPDGRDQDNDKIALRQIGNDLVNENERIFGPGFREIMEEGILKTKGDGLQHFLRPAFIQFYECENILLEGFTLRQSPFWSIHPVFSKNITIRNITVQKGTTNDDGIDPDSCEDVLIENCEIDTDDDPVSIKAGRDNDAWNRGACRNIIVRNIRAQCKVGNGFCIGSEMSGGVENVFVENYHIVEAPHGINFKCNLDRGGFIRNIFVRDVTIEKVLSCGLLFQMDYPSYRGGNYPPDFENFHLTRVRVNEAGGPGIRIAGVAEKPVRKVFLQNVQVLKQGQKDEIQYAEEIVGYPTK